MTREADGRKVPVILFTKNGGQWLDAMADTGCDALGLDWTLDIVDARARVGDRVARDHLHVEVHHRDGRAAERRQVRRGGERGAEALDHRARQVRA